MVFHLINGDLACGDESEELAFQPGLVPAGTALEYFDVPFHSIRLLLAHTGHIYGMILIWNPKVRQTRWTR
jgi:hypothetical protein